ncbi:diguanylate cyclase [Aerococcaceae bacterium WGS1372]
MLVNLLANIGIILINIYLVLKFSKTELDAHQFTQKQRVQYITLESIVGAALMYFSVTILDVRFDFRFILFSLSMKFLGQRITYSTIGILAVIRFAFGGIEVSVINLLFSLFFILTINRVFNMAKQRFETLGQLLTLNYYYIFLSIPALMMTLGGGKIILEILLFEIFISTAFTMMINAILRDVYQLATLTVTDGLTGLYNSRKFYKDIETIPQGETDYALIILDIDNFKTFNDVHGHLIGDNILRSLSAALDNMSAEDYSFYRFGGEEFVTVLKDDTKKLAYNIAKRIEDKVNQITILDNANQELKFTVSIGIAHQRRDEKLLDTFRRADKAMFVAKANGKNQIIID